MDTAFAELQAKIDSLVSQNSELRAKNAELVGKSSEDATTISDLQAKLEAAGSGGVSDDELKAETAKIDAALGTDTAQATDTLTGGADTVAAEGQ